VRAALISEYGSGLELAERESPSPGAGEALVELRAAALNPADVAVASGKFWAGSPPLPYIPGIEGLGVVIESKRFPARARVYSFGGGLGVARDGSFAERFVASEAGLIEVPDGVDDALAVALGTAGLAAWLPLTWLSPVTEKDSVLVLGATGVVGAVGVQAARVLGARRVVGVGRSPTRLRRAEEYGCDAVVAFGGDDFGERLQAACGDLAPTVVLDTLWGPAVEAALAVAARGARVLQIGQSAGATAVIPSAAVRGKQLQILGYSNFAVPADALARGYRDLLGHAAAGRIQVEIDTLPLERAPEAWARQLAGDDAKLVLVP
jgi:NADPH:quinone reductase-like Zn-dependent oxidoreductase